jgi:hypothetical protein
MTKPRIRRWTRDGPNPWDYTVPTTRGTVHGRVPTWQAAITRTLQLIADQT